MRHGCPTLFCFILAACGAPANPSPKTRAPAPTAPTPPSGSAQTCDIVVHDDSFVVDGERITPHGSGTVAQLVLRDGGTLVAGDNQLWLVDCKRTPHVKQLLASPSAAVRSGLLAPDGHALVFADGDISALDLATLATRRIYETPHDEPPNFCAMLPAKRERQVKPTAMDDVRGFADEGRTLVIERRWGCHYPDAYEYRLVDWADPAKAKLHPARAIHAVAVDPKGTLFIGDSGGLWRSTDRGATWKRIPIKGADDSAVVDVFADAKRPGFLVVRTAKRTEVAEGLRGSAFRGPAFRTRNGGTTWQMVVPPTSPPDPDGPEDRRYAAYVYSAAVVDGNVDHLLLETGMGDDTDPAPEDNNSEAPPEGEEGPVVLRVDQGSDGFQIAEPPRSGPGGWRATKNGKTWTQVAAPPRPKRTVTLRGDTFEATADGLYRTHAGKRELVTPLLAKPYYNDAY